jgi:biotin-dependent carboxylase-like uncharacterized protein
MGVIEVREPGLFTTVQDLGREGFGPLGVSPSGAADAISLRLGNRLVGNAEEAAGLEMTLLGGTFVFPDGAVLALAGSDFGAALDGKEMELWSSFEVCPGQALRLGPTRSGARCYLCVRGGIETKLFLGSASTHILSGLGGHEGRALRKGDALKIGATNAEAGSGGRGAARLRRRALQETGKNACPTGGTGAERPVRERRLSALVMRELQPRKVLRATPGPQSDWFPKPAQKMFYGSTYRVAEESNRMGLRLEGAPIAAPHGGGMISEGMALGAIQVPEGGLPIILFVEQQTTGGYPKIANVISADFHSLGQLRPRDEIRFERVEREAARSLLNEQEKLLAAEELFFA